MNEPREQELIARAAGRIIDDLEREMHNICHQVWRCDQKAKAYGHDFLDPTTRAQVEKWALRPEPEEPDEGLD